MNKPSIPWAALSAASLVVAATTAAGPLPTAGASARPGSVPPALTLDGHGTWQIRPWINDVVVNGTGQLRERGSRSIDVQVAAVVQTDDRTLPVDGECEPAFATVSAYGARGVDMTLVGAGEVCATPVQSPSSVVRHVFTGRYEVYGEDTAPRRLEGTDGFYELRLAEDGTASVFAVDT